MVDLDLDALSLAELHAVQAIVAALADRAERRRPGPPLQFVLVTGAAAPVRHVDFGASDASGDEVAAVTAPFRVAVAAAPVPEPVPEPLRGPLRGPLPDSGPRPEVVVPDHVPPDDVVAVWPPGPLADWLRGLDRTVFPLAADVAVAEARVLRTSPDELRKALAELGLRQRDVVALAKARLDLLTDRGRWRVGAVLDVLDEARARGAS